MSRRQRIIISSIAGIASLIAIIGFIQSESGEIKGGSANGLRENNFTDTKKKNRLEDTKDFQKRISEAITAINQFKSEDPYPLTKYIRELFEKDEKLALAVLNQLGEPIKFPNFVGETIYEYYSKFPLLEGINRYESLRGTQEELFNEITLDYTYEKAGTSPPSEVLEFISREDNDYFRQRRDVVIAAQMVEKNPSDALAAIESITDDELKKSMLSSAYFQWMNLDRYAATDYLSSREHTPEMNRAVQQLIYSEAIENPEIAMQWLDSHTNQEDKQSLQSYTLETWRNYDQEGFKKWLSEQPPEDKAYFQSIIPDKDDETISKGPTPEELQFLRTVPSND